MGKAGQGQGIDQPGVLDLAQLSRDNPWFSDVRVRRALLHAIDRDAMVQNLFKGEKVISHLPLSRARKSQQQSVGGVDDL